MNTFSKLLLSLVLFSSVLFVAACSSKYSKLEEQDEQKIVELQPENFRPSFTRETVIKLNGIVSRQLDVINEYDAMMGSVKKSLASRSEPSSKVSSSLLANLDKIQALSSRSKQNLADLLDAESDLIQREEYYNKATFAGMKNFVQDVEREISAKQDTLSDSLEKLNQVAQK